MTIRRTTQWRNVCLKCRRSDFNSPVKFSRHLGECKLHVDVDFIFEYLQVEKADGCWLMDDPDGSLRVPKFTVEPKQTKKVHIILAEAVHGEKVDADHMLCHWCDDRKCLNPDHLYWGTSQQNSLDAWRNSRRTMSDSQLRAMTEGRKNSPKVKARMAEHNRVLAEKNSGDNHWTRRSPDSMKRWTDAMTAGRIAAKKAAEGGDASCRP